MTVSRRRRKRLADLRDADEQKRQNLRQTKADALVEALKSADTAGVARLIDDLEE